jgi:hypothetical protein
VPSPLKNKSKLSISETISFKVDKKRQSGFKFGEADLVA